MATNTSFAMWSRIVSSSWDRLSPLAAEQIPRLGFPEQDQQRVRQLNLLASDSALTTDQRSELEQYLDVAAMLGILHARARRVLADNAVDEAAPQRKVS